jgi:hypothetical protein
MQAIQENLCDMPLSLAPVRSLNDFRNGRADMSLLETVARRATMEAAILLTLPCLAIETAVRLPFGLIALVFSVALSQDDSWKEEREFSMNIFGAVGASVFLIVAFPVMAVMNIYKETINF